MCQETTLVGGEDRGRGVRQYQAADAEDSLPTRLLRLHKDRHTNRQGRQDRRPHFTDKEEVIATHLAQGKEQAGISESDVVFRALQREKAGEPSQKDR